MAVKRLLGRLAVWSWYLAAIVLVLCAALVTLGQYYFPYLGDYREQLLARAAEDLPFGMEVAGLGAEWTGLAPTLHVQGLRLFAREEPAVTILSSSRSELRIDMLRSLFSLAPRLRRIVAEDVQLGFTEDAQGRWHIAGAGSDRAPANPDAIIDFFLAIEEIELRRTRLVLRAHEGGRVETEGAELSMENYRRFRRLRVTARDETPGGELSLLVESHGDPRQRGDFSAAAHLRLDTARLKRLQPLLGPDVRLPDAALSGELWARVSPQRALSLQGSLSTPELDPRAWWPRHGQLQPLRDLELRFAGQWSGEGGSLWLDELRCQWFGQPLELERVRIDARREAGTRHLKVGADYLDLGALAGAVQSSALVGGSWGEALADLAPYGGLANAQIDLSLPVSAAPDFRLRAQMIDVSVAPWRHAPGVRNVRGYLEMTPRGGVADIDSGAVSLDFPRLYHDELDFDRLAGRVSWARDEAQVQVGSERLQLGAGATDVNARFDLAFRKDPALDDYLSLAIGVRDADASIYRNYLPYGVSPALRDWLDASIEAGRIEHGAFVYHAIFGRPQLHDPASLQLGLDVRDVALAYHPDWPALRDATGRVLIDERITRAWVETGRMLQSDLLGATVELRPRREDRRMTVRAQLAGDVADGLRVINDSPVAAMTGGALRSWQGNGRMALTLDLDMPFGGRLAPETSRLGLVAQIADTRLFIGDLGLELGNVRGTLDYDLDQGLRSRRIDGDLWGKPLRAVIGASDPRARRIALAIDGEAELARVAEWLKVDPLDFLAGAAAFDLQLEQQERHGFGFVLTSRLEEAVSTLPAPLAKARGDALPLQLRWMPGATGTDIRLQLGGDVAAAMTRDRDGRLSGQIALGTAAQPGEGEDLRITGSLAQADAGAWIAAVQQLLAANAARGERRRTVVRIDGLQVASATLLGAQLQGLRLDSRWEDEDFVLAFGSDVLSGGLRIPGDRSLAYGLGLDTLQLRAFLGQPADAAAAAADGAGNAEPAQAAAAPPLAPVRDETAWRSLQGLRLPDTEVVLANTRLDEKDLGSWSFHLASEADALALTNVQATLPGLRVRGIGKDEGGSFRLRWIAGEPRSELALGLRSDDIGKFFDAWGYANVIESRTGRTDIEFSWPGAPTRFSLADTSGRMNFSWRDGRLLRGGENNPLMRAMGVLNFDEVLRRIRFDFKDFYQSGLPFDRFVGAFDLGDGFARVREPIAFEGPSARMRMTGQADLRRRTIDADLIVTLPIGSNLPWVAALAGGLPAAAGAYVASRIFEDQLGKFSSAVYKVSGALDEPEVAFVRVFDTESAGATAASALPPASAGSPAPVDTAAQPPAEQPQ